MKLYKKIIYSSVLMFALGGISYAQKPKPLINTGNTTARVKGNEITLTVKNTDMAVIEWLIEGRYELKFEAEVLMYMTYSSNVHDAQELIKLGLVDVDARGEGGRTPLMYASFLGEKEMVELLLSAGADVKLWDNNGNTALKIAKESLERMEARAQSYKPSIKLLSAGADANVLDRNGEALLIKEKEGEKRAVAQAQKYRDIIKLLERERAEIAKNPSYAKNKITPKNTGNITTRVEGNKIILTVKNHDMALVEGLINRGGFGLKFSAKTLMETVTHYRASFVKDIIASDLVDVNARDKDGKTALMRASFLGEKDMVELLLSAGADVKLWDNNGRTALNRAEENEKAMGTKTQRYRDIIKLLKDKILQSAKGCKGAFLN